MRISIFFLFFCVFSLMAKNSHSQNARVTINRTNVQLESILNEIESQTDYLFIYKDDVDVTSRKSIRVNNKSVSEVLLVLLSGSSITYKMEGNHIVLTRKETTTL
ncbi:STN domain-containing protein [Bacteroides stercorirosoris]